MTKETNKRTARQKDADELHMTSTLSPPAINLLTLIRGDTLSIDTTLDISLSVFRDAILGANTKDFSTIQTVLDSIKDTDGIKKITDAVTVIQPNPALLTGTVTQAAKDRTITSGNITTHKGDTDYDKVKKTGFYTTQQSDTTLWTPAAGKKFVITDIIVSVDTAMRVYLQDDSTKIWEWHFAANGGCVINLQTPDESADIDNVLSITMDVAGRCSIKVLGWEE